MMLTVCDLCKTPIEPQVNYFRLELTVPQDRGQYMFLSHACLPCTQPFLTKLITKLLNGEVTEYRVQTYKHLYIEPPSHPILSET